MHRTLNHKNTRQTPGRFRISIGGVFLVMIFVLMAGMFLKGIKSLEHYNRVYRDSLRVTATVTKHDSYTDEGNTEFYAYISYAVGDAQYTNIQYENKDHKTELTPIGQQVVITVSPEDPAKQTDDLLDARFSSEFATIPLAFLLAIGWQHLLYSKRSKQLTNAPDQEVLTRDLRLTIYGRFFLVFGLVLVVLIGGLWLRYPTVIDLWAKYTVAGCGIIWLYCLISAIRSLNAVKYQQYRIHRDVLVKKTETYDAEDGCSYQLEFQSDCGTRWSRHVTEALYKTMQEGKTVLAIYLPGKKGPVLHYNIWGDAE